MRLLSPLVIFIGVIGLMPFVGLTMAALFWGSLGPVTNIGFAVLSYSGCVLSFLGAVHWGLALEQPSIVPAEGFVALNRRRVVLGAMAPLLGSIAVYAGIVWSPRVGILIELLGFIAVWGVERSAYRVSALPAGYFPFRTFLTVLVVLCLAACLCTPLQAYAI